MRQRINVSVMILFLAGTIVGSMILQGQSPQSKEVAQAQPDGVAECHNFQRNGKKANCVCWGQNNPSNPPNSECKPPAGEDPRCTNHCKKELCKCKPKCQS
ncbi:MAG: hypothetical protein HYT61_02405 [Candidatus Yanofskybacteria bacterium]|nr:hypothetical protein [Candidatus Yanofskybacteria bacterium]